jgi:hypothetical protein
MKLEKLAWILFAGMALMAARPGGVTQGPDRIGQSRA